MNLDLTQQETEILATALDDYVSDLRMEIANTDSMEVRDELKIREALLKRVVSDLRGGAKPPRDVSGARNSPSR